MTHHLLTDNELLQLQQTIDSKHLKFDTVVKLQNQENFGSIRIIKRWTQTISNIHYADDTVLLAKSGYELETIPNAILHTSSEYELKIYTQKVSWW